ncbi:hypothetical protein O1Y80_004753 [Yersinia enterocolitica]|nr:hypothetical protein [Yersinia enterocolitica]EKN3834384.1 hypothetical protein [Yersinia enterocolitica]
MSEIKQYDTEVRLEAVMGTNHYGVHIHAMTTEDLHSKSGIAVELAWRDLRIEQLIAQLESAQKERDELRDKFNEMSVQKQFWVKCAKELESQLEKAEAELSAANEKLSKPVVLPIKYNPAVAGNKSTRANFIWHNDAISYCADAIKAAGFTVEE